MPNLIFESFYIKTLVINATGMPRQVQTSKHYAPFTIESYENGHNFKVTGELDTNGNVHSVYTAGPTGLNALHPVRFEGCPHILQIVFWLLPIDPTEPRPRPWETFNATPAMQRRPAYQYPKIQNGGITFKNYERRDNCFSFLREWAVASWTGYPFDPDDRYTQEVLGDWTPASQTEVPQ